MIDVSLIIVHYNTPGLLRQTLKSIFRAQLTCSFEVIVVDNDTTHQICSVLNKEFPQVMCIKNEKNVGFGAGMNQGMGVAKGRYYFVFNPDILLTEGSLESMVAYMNAHPQTAVLGPQLRNPDGTLQYSAFQFMPARVIAYRRMPILRSFGFAKQAVNQYLRIHEDHSQIQEVDYLLGAALLVRKKAVEEVGGFDPNFFVYFEDQDWCRRFHGTGWQVMYFPHAQLIHYHRRETAQGGFWRQLINPLTRVQLRSAIYYYWKWRK